MPSRSRSRGGNIRTVAVAPDDDSTSPSITSTSSADDAAGIHLLLKCSNNSSHKTPSTNNNNKNKTKSSNYRGVYWMKRDKVYHSTIKAGRKIHLGCYKLECDAGLAYDKASYLLRGSGTETNFASLKDYREAKKHEMNSKNVGNSDTMTLAEIKTKVTNIVSSSSYQSPGMVEKRSTRACKEGDNEEDDVTSSTSMLSSSDNNNDDGYNYTGIYFFQRDQQWKSQISRDGKKIYLGSFALRADAALAYDKANSLVRPPIRGLIPKPNFATLKNYERAKTRELINEGHDKDAAMTSMEIFTRVTELVTKDLERRALDQVVEDSKDFENGVNEQVPDECVSSGTINNNAKEHKKKTDAKLPKRDRKWICPECDGDVRLPPPATEGEIEDAQDDAKSDSTKDDNAPINEYLETTHVVCALKCRDPRFHLSCSMVPKGSQIYRNAILCCQPVAKGEVDDSDEAVKNEGSTSINDKCDAKQVLEHLYPPSKKRWWDLSTETKLMYEGKQRNHRTLHNDTTWSTSNLSYMCPDCDVEGSSRYLLEYFEQFSTMKQSFYTEYLNINDKDMVCRRDRADESVESRTGEAFLCHLVKSNQQDFLDKRVAVGNSNNDDLSHWSWNSSELQLANMDKILTYLSKQLQHQQKQQQQRREKRQKSKFHIDPSILVGKPIRLYNPIDNRYHSGRIIDCRVDAPHKIDDPISNLKSSDNSSAPNISRLTDAKVSSTLFLIRFREGVEGRKVPVHQWIYLEEHAVTVGGNICWAKVRNQDTIEIPDSNKESDTIEIPDSSTESDLAADEDCYTCPYRPVQMIFRSMLEMISVHDPNSGWKGSITTSAAPSLDVFTVGFGSSFDYIRLCLSDGGGTKSATVQQTEIAKADCNYGTAATDLPMTKPSAWPIVIPITPINPPWLDKMLQRAQLGDDDVAVGLALACMEKEEERRIRTWRRLSLSHLFQPSPIKLKNGTRSSPWKKRPVSVALFRTSHIASQPPKKRLALCEDPFLDNEPKQVGRPDDVHSHLLEMDSSLNNNTKSEKYRPMKKKQVSKPVLLSSSQKGFKNFVCVLDPRPVDSCGLCGPLHMGQKQSACETCQYLLKEQGWSFEINVKGRKRQYINAEGQILTSKKAFLIQTTDLVVKKMKEIKSTSRSDKAKDNGGSSTKISSPSDDDILLGRGGLSNKHLGNIRFRDETRQMRGVYQEAKKEDKTSLSEELVQRVKAYGGRFLRKDDGDKFWSEVSDDDARKKASQALREDKWQ